MKTLAPGYYMYSSCYPSDRWPGTELIGPFTEEAGLAMKAMINPNGLEELEWFFDTDESILRWIDRCHATLDDVTIISPEEWGARDDGRDLVCVQSK